MADKKSFSESDVLKAWSESAAKEDQYELRHVEDVDGKKQIWLMDKDTGSISAAVNDDGNALNRLGENVASPTFDAAIRPKDAVEDNAVHYTERGARMTPTMPEAMEGTADQREVNPKQELADRKAQSPDNQRSTTNLSESKSQPETKTTASNRNL